VLFDSSTAARPASSWQLIDFLTNLWKNAA